jgi:hypothetical protein
MQTQPLKLEVKRIAGNYVVDVCDFKNVQRITVGRTLDSVVAAVASITSKAKPSSWCIDYDYTCCPNSGKLSEKIKKFFGAEVGKWRRA